MVVVRQKAERKWKPQVFLAGAASMFLGIIMLRHQEPGSDEPYWAWFLIPGAAVVLGLAVHGWQRTVGSSGVVARWAARTKRNDGVASAWNVWRVAGRRAMRRKAEVVKPSLATASVWVRLKTPTKEYATPLARVGSQRVWSPVEDVTLRIGGPRTGKTGELACRILDAPGAVIATSTRTDLLELTGPVRKEKGPVEVFNPSGVGKLDSTIGFDPLAGCEDPPTATSRAADLMSGVSSPGSDGDRDYWTGQARRALAALMHAAALGDDCSMRTVLAWVSDPDSATDVRRYLRRSCEPSWQHDAAQFLATNDRTRSSITSTIMPALGWLSDATASSAACTDTAERNRFDVERLLAEHGSVFMLGAEDSQVAPLVTALTGFIAREARRIAGEQPKGRLDPALTLALDEAALICPIPLDNWTADMGGRGVTIHIAAQSRAQLRQRWGETGADSIMNNAATLLLYGGTRSADDLAAYSTLTGERDEKLHTHDADGRLTSTTSRKVPVLSSAEIARMPERRVVIIRRNMPPAIGRVQMAWKRPEVKKAARLAKREANRVRKAQAAEPLLDGPVGYPPAAPAPGVEPENVPGLPAPRSPQPEQVRYEITPETGVDQ